jgi:uncharacterized protein DUF5946
MRCDECGADLPYDQTCAARFEALLASDFGGVAEAFDVHGLTVLTYQLQHPHGAKPWYLALGYELMRRIFGQGEDWREVLLEMRQGDTVERWKRAVRTEPPGIVKGPVPGEITIAEIDPAAPAGHAERVLAWARSVAQGRVGVGNAAASEQ